MTVSADTASRLTRPKEALFEAAVSVFWPMAQYEFQVSDACRRTRDSVYSSRLDANSASLVSKYERTVAKKMLAYVSGRISSPMALSGRVDQDNTRTSMSLTIEVGKFVGYKVQHPEPKDYLTRY